MSRKYLGTRGENLALSHLTKIGYRFVDRNFSCPLGEIDLILLDKNTLVFVEVKTRFSEKFGKPESAVTTRKLAAIIKTAHWFKTQKPNLPDKQRIDVVAIDVQADGTLLGLRHIKNVTG